MRPRLSLSLPLFALVVCLSCGGAASATTITFDGYPLGVFPSGGFTDGPYSVKSGGGDLPAIVDHGGNLVVEDSVVTGGSGSAFEIRRLDGGEFQCLGIEGANFGAAPVGTWDKIWISAYRDGSQVGTTDYFYPPVGGTLVDLNASVLGRTIDRLCISSLSHEGVEYAIDNIQLGPAVPEPLTIAGFAFATFGVAGYVRRRIRTRS